MKRRTPEQEAQRRARRAREATFPKCRCGNVLSLEAQLVTGETRCPACIHADMQRSWPEVIEARLLALEEKVAKLTE